jgi:pyruvate/2-oxoglutarate dehydrogenase complex dihydrolipoamide acyltransferase (E2) component
MENKIVLPELGEGIEKAVVAGWNVEVGDPISIGDDVVEVVTDKAVFNVPAVGQGTLSQKFVQEGQEVEIGSVLGTMTYSENQ